MTVKNSYPPYASETERRKALQSTYQKVQKSIYLNHTALQKEKRERK